MALKIFTFIVIAWVFYQLGVHYLQKEKQHNTRNSSGPFKIPPMESWQELLRQDPEKGPRQVGSFDLTELKRFENTGDYYFETEGTQGIEGNSGIERTWGAEGALGIEGTSGIDGYRGIEGTRGIEGAFGIEGTDKYAGMLGQEVYKSAGVPDQKKTGYPSGSGGVHLSLSQRELVQAVVWAEILGKPRALRPFKRHRS